MEVLTSNERMSAITIFSSSMKISMSLDHLCEEGPAHRKEIEIPFNVILFFCILLTISYGIHLNGHFYLFGLIARILFWIYHLWSRLNHTLFYWYFLLHFNCDIKPKETTMDSTQSRDYQTDQQILLETLAPDTEVLITVRPQINFLQHNGINEIFHIVTYTANAAHIIPTFPNLSVTVSTLQISDAPILYRDKQLEEILIGEERCHNFINQDLTFLQPSTVYEATTQDDTIPPQSNQTDVPLNTSQETNQPQEEDSNRPHPSLAELFYDSTRIANRPTPIQPGLTPEEQHRREEDPNLTQDELLGLSSCEDHINTPLQTLDELYDNRPSRFLPLAQEAKKLAKRIKAEEEASQWSGIPVEQLLNNSFTEQLNCIQSPADSSSSQCKGPLTTGYNNYP